jgi:hypothetical protein
VNRPAKQTRPISANFCPNPGIFGVFPGTSRKMHLGVFSGASGNSFLCSFSVDNKIRKKQDSKKLVTKT